MLTSTPMSISSFQYTFSASEVANQVSFLSFSIQPRESLFETWSWNSCLKCLNESFEMTHELCFGVDCPGNSVTTGTVKPGSVVRRVGVTATVVIEPYPEI